MPDEHDAADVGSVVNALPIERMIGGPLDAMIQAQINASKRYADFIMGICLQPGGKARMLEFDYDEMLVDTEGNEAGRVKRTMRIPLIAAVPHPNVTLEGGAVEFELEVTEVDKEVASSETITGLPTESAKIKGRVTHKVQQTRKSDSRAKYSIRTELKRQATPEAMMRVIDYLTDAATRPVAAEEQAPPTQG